MEWDFDCFVVVDDPEGVVFETPDQIANSALLVYEIVVLALAVQLVDRGPP